jgi:type IV pilus assembly protein PilY1
MNKSVVKTLIGIIVVLCATTALAAPDQYPGDTSIYGSETVLDPNVLIIIDDSGSMSDTVTGGNYAHATTYTVSAACGTSFSDNCASNEVYQVLSSGSATVYSDTGFALTSVTTSCSGSNYQSTLSSTGQLNIGSRQNKLSSTGTCGTSGSAQYVLGNYVNWLNAPGSAVPKLTVVKNVVSNLIKSTTGVRFGVMTYNYDSNGNGFGGTFIAGVPSGATATYTTTIQDMDTIFQGTMTNRTALRRVIQGIQANGNTPLAETLYEAGQYFMGGAPAYGATVGVSASGTYVSPAVPSCRHNYVVFLTDGMSTADNYTSTNLTPWADSGVGFLENTLGSMCTTGNPAVNTADCDGNGGSPGNNDTTGNSLPCYTVDSNGNPTDTLTYCCETSGGTPVSCTSSSRRSGPAYLYYDYSHTLPDVAEYLNKGPQNISSYFIGFGADVSSGAAVNMLTTAADGNHGKGQYYTATGQTDLSTTFTNIIANIQAVNSSYVAPVVPVSPQNRTYTSNRIYMGFFKPENNMAAWLGNMKKYGIDINNNITDVTGTIATWVDVNGDGKDDNTGVSLPAGAVNGSFKATAQSYWSTAADGGNVDAGGVGALLQARANITTSRTIYTVASTTPAPASSLVALNSSSITPTLLNVANDGTTAPNLINFIYGLNVYGTNPTLNKAWVMGDVMHSRPLVVNYAQYTFCDPTKGDNCSPTAATVPTANEKNCSVNLSMIYVAGNDGMLHAFYDCSGQEAWAFVPPDMLPNLQYLTGTLHTYYADSSPSVYIYNQDNSGTINQTNSSTNKDKVILMFGGRRGGGSNIPSGGVYYALDVTNETAPKFLWSISNSTPGFSEMGETWSEPNIVKMNIGGTDEIVALFGAGYDNANEDMRYGNTQSFSGVTPVNNGDIGQSPGVSASGSAVTPQHGRGIFAVQLATLTNGVPTIASAPTKIWSYTYGTGTPTSPYKYDPTMNFSLPGQITAIDSIGLGYTDTLYTADTGGNLWRFNVGNTSVTNWTGTKIFSSNPGYPGGALNSSDTGRKIFYKPSVVTQAGYRMIFFGTGDREHPLNTNVTDRIYAVKDPTTTPISTALTEYNLLDVTTDQLQTLPASTNQADINNLLNTLLSPTAGGWFIQLPNTGEKVLAAPTVFNKVAYFTTFAPGITNTDVCGSGNLGTSRLYALNYQTGEAVLNFNTGDDIGTAPNSRAVYSGGGLLNATDRSTNTGSGIPSGLVILITPGGQTKAYTGIGGAISSNNPPPGGSMVPLYWRQK